MPTDVSALARATAAGVVSLESRAAAVVDSRHRIVAANAAFREQLVSGGDVVGRRCHELAHERARPCNPASGDCPLARARSTGAPARVVHVHSTLHGSSLTLVRARPAGGAPDDRWYLLVHEPIREASARPAPGRLVGRSRVFRDMLEQMSRAARGRAPVLFLGPGGSGKRRAARALHAMSSRSGGPFVSLDCRDLCDPGGAGTLFGASGDSGAIGTGLVDRAERGSLYLGSVSELPPSLRRRVLRLVESGLYLPVGAGRARHADVRLLAGSALAPAELAAAARLGPELAATLATFRVEVAPLARRREDILLIAESALQELRGHEPVRSLASAFAAALGRYSFPGNVRELLDVLERAWLGSQDGPVALPNWPPRGRARARDDAR